MIRAIHKRLEEREEGFTLIELLVVVIIIGILAAIAIPTFLGQRERGWEANAQSDLKNAQLAVESCAVAQGGVYSGTGLTDCGATASLTAEGWRQSPSVTTTVDASAGNAYTITSRHASGGDQFDYSSATGATVRSTP